MIRRFISTVALVGCAAVSGAAYTATPERATFILTSGERKAGPVVFHGSDRENLINGYLNLGVDTGGPEFTIPMDQVAVIDFVGGRPSNVELGAVGAGHAIALRNGTVEQGRFINIIGGEVVRWQDQNGNARDIPIQQVSRIYLNPDSALTTFRYRRSTAAAVGTTGTAMADPNALRVMANQPWTSTGIVVRRGDLVTFHTSGQVTFGMSPGQVASADGNDNYWRPGYPVNTMPAGSLIGRVGNSAPFPIGSSAQPIQMPASGVLMLGVNDDEVGDNNGYFAVVVTK